MNFEEIKKKNEAASKEAYKRITSREYDSLVEAKSSARNIALTENALVSVWMKETDSKMHYYAVLSKDKEIAFREGFIEVVKSYAL